MAVDRLRGVLREERRRVRGGEAPRGGGVAPSAAGARGRRFRRVALGGAGAPGAAAARYGQRLVEQERPAHRHGDVPLPLGRRVLVPRTLGESVRVRRAGRDMGAAPRPRADRARPGAVRRGVRLRGAGTGDSALAGGGGLVPLLQPAGGVRRVRADGSRAAHRRHGHGRAAVQPRVLSATARSRRTSSSVRAGPSPTASSPSSSRSWKPATPGRAGRIDRSSPATPGKCSGWG